MIEQLHYAPTSRYSFSQLTEKQEFPKTFIELSLSSMQTARGKHFQPYSTEFFEPEIEKTVCEEEPLKLEGKTISTLLTHLRPVRDGTPVVAIDVSSIKIGETEAGILSAIRGAIVWNERSRYRYVRLGPFPFHLTEQNKTEVLASSEPYSSLNLQTVPLAEAQNRLCSMTERWIQMSISNSSHGAIILWDGSLAGGRSGSSTGLISLILKSARKNLNSVLSFSKATSVRFLNRKITDLISKEKAPCLFEVEDLPLSISRSSHLLGRIYVTKLTNCGYSFRLDIDASLPSELRIMAVQRLLGNELIFQGYPETLRLAHIFSTFTANDVMGIQRYIAEEYGLRPVSQPNIRKMLFGPFGTGFGD